MIVKKLGIKQISIKGYDKEQSITNLHGGGNKLKGATSRGLKFKEQSINKENKLQDTLLVNL